MFLPYRPPHFEHEHFKNNIHCLHRPMPECNGPAGAKDYRSTQDLSKNARKGMLMDVSFTDEGNRQEERRSVL